MLKYVKSLVSCVLFVATISLGAQAGNAFDRGRLMTEAEVGGLYSGLTMLPQNEESRKLLFKAINDIIGQEGNFKPIYIKLLSVTGEMRAYVKGSIDLEKQEIFLMLTESTMWRIADKDGVRVQRIEVLKGKEFDVKGITGWFIAISMDKITKKVVILGAGAAN